MGARLDALTVRKRTMPSPSTPRTDRRTTPPAARRTQASAAYYLLRRLTWRPMLRPRLRRGLSPDWCRCHNLFGARRPWRKQQVVRLVIRDQWRLALDESFGHDGPCDRERLWADPARRKHDIPAPFRLLARAHAQTRRRVSGGAVLGDGWGLYWGVSSLRAGGAPQCLELSSALDQHGPEDGATAWCLAWASWTAEERHGPWWHGLLAFP